MVQNHKLMDKYIKQVIENGCSEKNYEMISTFLGRTPTFKQLIDNKLTITRGYMNNDEYVSESTEFIKKNCKIKLE